MTDLSLRAKLERDRIVEMHARRAVLEVQQCDPSYTPTPEQANLLHNMRFILSAFAAALDAAEQRGAGRGGHKLTHVERLVLDLQEHAKEHGWQDVDEPIAALLAWEPPQATASQTEGA